jgi:uncharacterized protein YqgC (DUF456 family)
MHWMLYVVAALFCLLGAACVAMVVVQLPGTWVLLGLAGLVEWLDRFWLPPDDPQTFGWWVLGGCLGLAVAGEIIEFIAGVLGAKRGGSSRRGMIGALVGGIAGIFVFTPLFFFVPFLGAFLGAVLGTFVGALIGELSAAKHTLGGSMKPALAATIGRVIGTTSKIGIAMAMWVVLSVAAFWG